MFAFYEEKSGKQLKFEKIDIYWLTSTITYFEYYQYNF